ncbi:MAG: ribosome biogenesis GTP-binding protein YihA/YsxC [Gemmatimonadales bacterium]|nr:ribosome biogenesis GTP-binding protein YihA/YsxC [Gemmatimonadales bacterium]
MDVRFVTSAPDLASRPELVLPEFAFLGRSNCGKSSLINHFLERVGMAKTSSKPGKTRLLNYFLVEDSFYIVDLPGYGFAKVSKKHRAIWWDVFQRYLACQDRPLALFHLLDSRREPSVEDIEVSSWMVRSGHPFALAATKIDKVSINSRASRYSEIIQSLGVPASTPFFPTSAKDRMGRLEMLAWVEALLEDNPVEG